MKRGFALAAVLFALTVLGALAAAALFSALGDARAAQQARDAVRVQRAARSAIADVLSSWDVLSLNALAPRAAAAVVTGGTPGVATSAAVHRINEGLLLALVSAGAAGGAATTAWQLVQLDRIETAPAAVRAHAADAALVPYFDGTDRPPAGWSCAAPGPAVPALLLQPGVPDPVFFQFGRRDWANVTGWAAAVLSGGDSLRVRYSSGGLVLAGGRVLGTVVVDGDLTLSGGVEIVGLVLVRGALRFDAGGGGITGLVVASQVIAQNGFTPSGTVAGYSSCAALAAMFSRASPRGLPGISSGVMY